MFITLFKEEKIFLNIYKKDENNRDINIYQIKNIIFTGYNLFYPNILLKTEDKLILPILERTMSLKNSSIYEKYNMEFIPTKKEIIYTCEDPLFFFCYNNGNYFHFLYDTLPYLISFNHLKKKIKNLKILTQYPNEDKKHYLFFIESLNILNINIEDILIINDQTLYKHIYISTSYTHDFDSNLPPRKEIFYLYHDMIKKAKNDIKTPKKIYISRRTHIHSQLDNIGTNYTTRRKMVNEDELVDKLKKDNYEEIFTEKLSMIEKINYFNNAEHIIGPIGGGIANVVFCNDKCKLESIISPGFLDINRRFTFCLDRIKNKYNFNTEHIEKSEFKKYMRAKTENNIIGEIEDYDNENIVIKYTAGDNTSWELNKSYKLLKINKQKVEKLDNGLNSKFKIKLDDFFKPKKYKNINSNSLLY